MTTGHTILKYFEPDLNCKRGLRNTQRWPNSKRQHRNYKKIRKKIHEYGRQTILYTVGQVLGSLFLAVYRMHVVQINKKNRSLHAHYCKVMAFFHSVKKYTTQNPLKLLDILSYVFHKTL